MFAHILAYASEYVFSPNKLQQFSRALERQGLSDSRLSRLEWRSSPLHNGGPWRGGGLWSIGWRRGGSGRLCPSGLSREQQ